MTKINPTTHLDEVTALKNRLWPVVAGADLTDGDRAFLRGIIAHVDACRHYRTDSSKAAVMDLCTEALDIHLGTPGPRIQR